MPKGPALTEAEREEIVSLRKQGQSAREIGLKIERSKTVVLNYLKNPTKYGTVKRSGRKRALTEEQEAQIVRTLLQRGTTGAPTTSAANGKSVEPTLSAERIKKEFNLPLSIRRIQQLLSDWRRDARKALDQQHALPVLPAREGEEKITERMEEVVEEEVVEEVESGAVVPSDSHPPAEEVGTGSSTPPTIEAQV